MIKVIIMSVLISLCITNTIMIWDNIYSTQEKSILLILGLLISTFLMYVIYS
jgi:hypothetical protein